MTLYNWHVYYKGEYVGDVPEETEEYARHATRSQFEFPDDPEGHGTWDMELLSVVKT